MGSQQSSGNGQRRVVKTLLLVTVALVILWGPSQIFYLLTQLNAPVAGDAYWWTSMLALLNVCVNPLLYAAKHDAIKKQVNTWLRLATRGTSGVGPGVRPTAAAAAVQKA